MGGLAFPSTCNQYLVDSEVLFEEQRKYKFKRYTLSAFNLRRAQSPSVADLQHKGSNIFGHKTSFNAI